MTAKVQDEWDDSELPSLVATQINKDREKTYGDPVPNMRIAAQLITPVVYPEGDRHLQPEQVAMILMQLKVMREVMGDYPIDYPDNLVDNCGWANVLYKCKEARRGSE